MKILILSSVLFLTGCASQCTHHCVMGFGPGNKMFEVMGDHYNTMDPCQHYGKEPGYKLADFCFANAGKKVYHIKDTNGKIVYKVQ